jgi:hypothetical protein
MTRFVGAAALILVACVGCSTSSTDPLRGLSFVASTTLSPTKALLTTASVTNENSDSVTVHYGTCPLDVFLHTGTYDGPVVYESAAGRGCTLIALQKTLAPGETLQFTESDAPPVAAGTYYVTVRIEVNGFGSVSAGTVTL